MLMPHSIMPHIHIMPHGIMPHGIMPLCALAYAVEPCAPAIHSVCDYLLGGCVAHFVQYIHIYGDM